MRPEVLWTPSAERVERAHDDALSGLDRAIARAVGSSATRSCGGGRWTDLEDFWSSIVEFFDVRFRGAGLGGARRSREMPGAQWFPGAAVSYAEHIFRGKEDDAIAIQHASELRPLASWTWGRLRSADGGGSPPGCGRSGVGRGRPRRRLHAEHPRDRRRVPRVRVDRGGVVLGRAGVRRAQRDRPIRADRAQGAAGDRRLPLRRQGLRPRARGRADRRRDPVARAGGAARLPGRLGLGGRVPGSGAELEFTPLPFDHPLWVLYSSGTTGLPKPIVHSQGGILLEQVKKLNLHLDAQAGDRVFWFSTTGWMMWNFLVGVLLTDASIILFDGNPGYPGPGDAVGPRRPDAGMTTFGTSAAFISACMKAGVRPRAGRDLSAPGGGGLDGLAAVAGGLSVDLRPARVRDVAVLDLRRHRHVHGVRRRRADAAGVPGRAAGAGAGRGGASRGIRRVGR